MNEDLADLIGAIPDDMARLSALMNEINAGRVGRAAGAVRKSGKRLNKVLTPLNFTEGTIERSMPVSDAMEQLVGAKPVLGGDIPMADAVEGIFRPNIATTRHPGLPPIWEDANFGQTPDLSDFNRSGPAYNAPVNVAQMRSEGLSPRTARGEQALALSRDAWAAEKAGQRTGQYMMNQSTSVMPPGARAPALMTPTILPANEQGGDMARYLAQLEKSRAPLPADKQEELAQRYTDPETNRRIQATLELASKNPTDAFGPGVRGAETARAYIAAKALKERGLGNTGVAWGPRKEKDSSQNRPQWGPGSDAESISTPQPAPSPAPQGPWDRGPSVFRAGLPEDERQALVTQNAMMRALNRRARMGGIVNIPFPDSGSAMGAMFGPDGLRYASSMNAITAAKDEAESQRLFSGQQADAERQNRLDVEGVRAGPRGAQAEVEKSNQVMTLANSMYKQATAGLTSISQAQQTDYWRRALDAAKATLSAVGSGNGQGAPGTPMQDGSSGPKTPGGTGSASTSQSTGSAARNLRPLASKNARDIVDFVRTNFRGAGGDPAIRSAALNELASNDVGFPQIEAAISEIDPTKWNALSLPFRNFMGLFSPTKSPLYYPELRNKYSGFSTGEESAGDTAARQADIALLKMLRYGRL